MKRMGETLCPMSGYKGMWLFVFFDLPVKTKTERRSYTTFRKDLLREGFSQMQFSVYARYFEDADLTERKKNLICQLLPPKGQVRLLAVTDAQFGKMLVFHGKKRQTAEKAPGQILLF